MNWNEETYELIEQYLCGALKGQARVDFEKKLESNPDLKEQFDLQKITRDAVIINNLSNVKSLMENDLKKKRPWKGIIIGFSIIALGIGSWFLYQWYSTESQKENNIIAQDYDQDASDNSTNKKPINTIDNVEKATTNSNKSITQSTSIDTTNTDTVPQLNIDNSEIIEDSVKSIDESKDSIVTDNNTNLTKSVFDCSNTKITGLVSTVNPKYDEEYGQITIANRLIGGTPAYKYRLNTTSFSSNRTFDNAKPGRYLVIVQDANQCIDTIKQVTLIKDYCIDDYNNSFTPSSDYEWQIPSIKGKSGTFTLYSKNGTEVVKIDITESEYQMWLGDDNNNAPVPSGFYRFVIEYQDGNYCKGSLSILR